MSPSSSLEESSGKMTMADGKEKSVERIEVSDMNSIQEDGTLEFKTKLITPTSSFDGETSENANPLPKSIEKQLKEAQLDAKQSADALEDLVLGIRAVKRILDRNATSASSNLSDNTSSNATDDDLLSSLSERLHGVLGSDLLALANAADMAREHAKLASEEASVLVSDINKANEEAEKAKARAHKAEKLTRKLYKENLSLHSKVAKLKTEKRTLVKEVKDLRKVAEETNKKLSEKQMFDSMSLHERLLKTPTSTNISKISTNKAVSPEENTILPRDSPSTGNVSDSPLPSLDEITGCSEDSSSYEEVELPQTDMPKNVSFDSQTRNKLSSPLQSPNVSPPGVGDIEPKPISDPSVLKTLALPGKENEGNILSSPRIRVAPGRYEV